MKLTSLLAATLVGVQSATAFQYVYLVNSQRGNNEFSSGIAYYGEGHSADTQSQPDDYTDVVHGTNVHWEGGSVTGVFGSGVAFNANIVADAASRAAYDWVGTGSNGFHNFNCYKTTNPGAPRKIIYTVDGWNVASIYWCVNNYAVVTGRAEP